MEKRPLLFLDSGIGGIPYCRHFIGRNPAESVVYLADRLHFPYGRREKAELVKILSALIGQILQIFMPKIAVIACNTATLAALPELRELFPDIPFVGTVPAVKPASLASKTGKIGVLGTELTIREPYIEDIAAQYGSSTIIGIAAPELVDFIEDHLFSATEEEKREMIRLYLKHFREAGADALVLGCTHFLFLQEQFQQEAAPDITVFDSLLGITQRIESLLEILPPEEHILDVSPNRLLLTGPEPPEASWTDLAERLGFDLSLLGPP